MPSFLRAKLIWFTSASRACCRSRLHGNHTCLYREARGKRRLCRDVRHKESYASRLNREVTHLRRLPLSSAPDQRDRKIAMIALVIRGADLLTGLVAAHETRSQTDHCH